MTTPITLMPQNNIMSSALIKTIDGNFVLHSVCVFKSLKKKTNCKHSFFIDYNDYSI